MGDEISRRDALGGLAATLGIAAGGPLVMTTAAGAAVPGTAHVTGWVVSCDGLASYARFGLRLVRCDDGSFRLVSTHMLSDEWREFAGVGARVTTSRLSEKRAGMPVPVADVFSLDAPKSPVAVAARKEADRQGWLSRKWTERRVVDVNEDGPVLALMTERAEQFSDPIELDYMTPRRFPRLQFLRDVRVNDVVRISWGQGWDRALLFEAAATGENIAPPPSPIKGNAPEDARRRARMLERQIARGLNPTAKAVSSILNDPVFNPGLAMRRKTDLTDILNQADRGYCAT
jgi:hypothetical protein